MGSSCTLNGAFDWEPPASAEAISQAEAEYGAPLPEAYVALLKRANGGTTQGNLSILSVEECVQRNIDYEVADYMPGYFMVGDDGGGSAILINLRNQRVVEADMGVMDESFAEHSADSLTHLIELGTSLGERETDID